MSVGYHVTDRSRIGSIRRHGLIPRDTAKWNHPQYAKNELAVYFFTDREEAQRFLDACANWTPDRKLIMLRIDLSGHVVYPDPSFRTLKSSIKSLKKISASKILPLDINE